MILLKGEVWANAIRPFISPYSVLSPQRPLRETIEGGG